MIILDHTVVIRGMFGMFFVGSLYMQRVLEYTALQIGLAFLPVAVVIGVLSTDLSPRLSTRFGASSVLLPGSALVLAGLALFTRAPVDAAYLTDILPAMLLLGTGAGLSFPALMTLAMSNATHADAGLASGLVNTSAQVGGALGLAVLASLSATHTERLLADGAGVTTALAGGYQLAFGLGAALVLAAIGLTATVLRPERTSRITPLEIGATSSESKAA